MNGDKVYESEVTDYIEGFRSKNQQYETDSAWAEFLTSNSYTAETIREHVLDEYFIPKLLIRQECSQRGIALTDEQLDDVIAREKEYYEQRYGENSWESVLASYGYDEASWRENESDRLLEEQLEDQVVKKTSVTSSELQEQANETAANYNGKHSWYALFDSEEQANEARAALAPDDEGKTTLKRFRKKVKEEQNAGWNSLASDRDDMTTAYVSALDGLSRNQLSEPVQIGQSWALVFCDQVFKVSNDATYVSLKKIPADIREQIEDDALESKRDKAFKRWLDRETENAQIVISEMPEGLVYAVNVAIEDEGA